MSGQACVYAEGGKSPYTIYEYGWIFVKSEAVHQEQVSKKALIFKQTYLIS